jgi:hypothetical protein
VIFHLHVYSGRICHGSVRVSRRLAVAADAVGSCVEDRTGQGRAGQEERARLSGRASGDGGLLGLRTYIHLCGGCGGLFYWVLDLAGIRLVRYLFDLLKS